MSVCNNQDLVVFPDDVDIAQLEESGDRRVDENRTRTDKRYRIPVQQERFASGSQEAAANQIVSKEDLEAELAVKKRRLAEIKEQKTISDRKRSQDSFKFLAAQNEENELAGFFGEQARQEAQAKRDAEAQVAALTKRFKMAEQKNTAVKDNRSQEELRTQLKLNKERMAEIQKRKQEAAYKRSREYIARARIRAAQKEENELAGFYGEQVKQQAQAKREAEARIAAITKQLKLIQQRDTIQVPLSEPKATVPNEWVPDTVAELLFQAGIGPAIEGNEPRPPIEGLKLKIKMRLIE